MTRFQAMNRCRRLNESRDVRFHDWLGITAADYWQQCSVSGSFLINGGSEGQRTMMLVSMLEDFCRRCADPVIVLTRSELTMRSLIRARMQQRLPRLSVTSSKHQNYHAFYGMEEAYLVHLMLRVARERGYDSLDLLESYIKAFIAAVATRYTPSLAAMDALANACSTAYQLEAFAASAGVPAYRVEAIHNYPAGAQRLRNLLDILKECFGNIMPDQCNSGHNILTGVAAGKVMCVMTNSQHPEIMDLAIGTELRQLIEKGKRFVVILDGIPLYDMDGIYQQLVDAQNTGGVVRVGVCSPNASAWARSIHQVTDPVQRLLGNTKNFVLLNSGTESVTDTQSILSLLGSYHGHEVQSGGGRGALNPFSSGQWSVVSVGFVDRVRMEDWEGYSLLLSGHDGRNIHLYRRAEL